VSWFDVYYVDFGVGVEGVHDFVLAEHGGATGVLGVDLAVVLALETAEVVVAGAWFVHHLFKTVYLMEKLLLYYY
jgi:hypothetical protein